MPAIPKALEDQWADRRWRLNNLYRIVNEDGIEVPFRLNWAQEKLLNELHHLNVILKARQLGFTTLIDLYMLDECVFNSNVRAGVIAHTREDAENFFRDKVKFPYDNLDEAIRDANPATQDSARHLSFQNNSSIRVGTSMRSGTLQILHVSEYGKICAKYPEKAVEIQTGAFNTVHLGQMIFVESTAEGQEGHFYQMVDEARTLQQRGAHLTEMDFKFHFFPWFQHPGYALDHKQVAIPAEMGKYFEKLHENQGVELTPDQMAWYVAKTRSQGPRMKREFPSTPEEAFEAALLGAYYANEMSKIYLEGRVRAIPLETGLPVHTWWDLGIGASDITSIGFIQIVGGWFHVVDYYQHSGVGLAHYAKVLQDKQRERGWVYGEHVWPHDGNAKILDEKGRRKTEVMGGLGYKPRIVPRTNDVGDGIELVRNMLAKCVFDETRCEGDKSGEDEKRGLLPALKAYRREWDEKTTTWRERPLHNWASHAADMMRCGAEHQPRKSDFTRKLDYPDLGHV